jgi:uncharacterized protein YkwD
MTRKTWTMLAALLVILVQTPVQAWEGTRRPLFRLGSRSPRTTYRVADARLYDSRYQQASRTLYTPVPAPGQAGVEYRLAAYEPAPMPVEAAPAAATPEPAAPAVETAPASGDPYGFAPILNQYRASVGLPPVAVDANLSAWASQNNAAQTHRGLGHHINPNCFQNCAWNYASAWGVIQGWLDSPGHRANMFSPSITRVGIAYGPGPYWTMNAQ